jgi:hypothetical protein
VNPLDQVNPLYLLIFVVALMVATPAAKASASGRRILAVVFGSFMGYGIAVSVNAVLTSLMSWHQLPTGAAAYTGDIMTGLMVAGSGLGLIASLFIRDRTPSTSPGDGRELSELQQHLG